MVVLPETDSEPSAVPPTTPPKEALPVTDRPCCPAVVAFTVLVKETVPLLAVRPTVVPFAVPRTTAPV